MASSPRLNTSDENLICEACGTQHPVTSLTQLSACRICDDPRQFVPPSGQAWTTLSRLRESGHRTVWERDAINPQIWSFWTEPKVAIGQRAMLLQTSHGNVMWDMITLLDAETIKRITELGGLAAIVISHPHYYTTIHDWSACFPDTPIYLGAGDREWLVDPAGRPSNIHFLTALHHPILPGVTAVLSGGHFPGSLCLHWDEQLFIADTIFTVPSAQNPEPGKEGVTSYNFWYSVPNRIPLSPLQVWDIWKSVKDLEFHSTFGAFWGMDVRSSEEEIRRGTGGVKGRLLESVKIFVRGMGWLEEEKTQREAVREIMGAETKGTKAAPGNAGGKKATMKTDFVL